MRRKKMISRLISAITAVALIIAGTTNGVTIQAQAAVNPVALQSNYLSETTKYLYLGDQDAKTFDFDIKKEARQKGATYLWYVNTDKGNSDAVTINKKTGVVTAKKAGTAYIGCKITLSDGTSLNSEAKVTVRNNIKEVEISNLPDQLTIPSGSTYDFNRKVLNTDAGKGVRTQGITGWEISDDTAGVDTVSAQGIVFPIKEGEFKIRAVCFQSTAKYKAWVADKEANKTNITAASAWATIKVASSQGTATASTQDQLNKLLAANNMNLITLSTKEALLFVIPEGYYYSTSLIVNAPNADVENHGIFKDISIKAIKDRTWIEYANGNVVYLQDDTASFVIDEKVDVKRIVIDRADSELNIKVDGSVEQIVILQSAKVNFSGNGVQTSVLVEATAGGSAITSSMPLNLEIKAKTDITLNEGAGNTILDKNDSKVVVKIENNTNKDSVITTNRDSGEAISSGKTVISDGGTVIKSGGTSSINPIVVPPTPTPTIPIIIPTAKVSAITFTDTDTNTNKIGGTLSWTAPADVTNVTHYVVYASANGTTKGAQIGADVAVGTNQLTIPAGTALTPYLIVVTKNSTGEATSSNYVSKAVTDSIAVPTAKVSAITFTDTDTDTNKIGGTLSWTAPADVSNVTHYVVYASTNGSTKGAQIGSNVAVGTNQLTIPAGTTMTPYIIVVTKNSTGEAIAANYVNMAVTDTIGVPTAKVSAITFTDTDTDMNKIGGTLSWTAPADVSNVTHYVVYASADGTTKGTQIGSNVAVGTNQLTIPAGTALTPYIIVVTKNSTGEATSSNYVNKAVTDTIAVPTVKVSGLSFTDSDPNTNKIGAMLSWTAPTDVSNVTHYVVYASTDGTTKGAQIGEDVEVGTNDIMISFGTAWTPYIIVVTKNSAGEATSSNYVNIAVTDKITIPTVQVSGLTFADSDANTGKIGGTLSWTAPSDVSIVTHYVVYASTNGTTKGTQIGSYVAVGTNQLTIPTGTTLTPYIIVVARNSEGEALTENYVSIEVVDTIAVPTAKVSAITFTDTDTNTNKIGGTLSWTAPADVTNVTHYVVYASADGTTKGTQIGANVAVGTNQLTIPAGTTMTPYILVVTRNSTGEAASSNYVNKAVTDTIAVPTEKVSAITFTDTDTDTNKIGGTLSWTAPADVSNVTHYVVYASADGTTKGTQIGANVAVGTNQLTIPAGTTMTPYILVVTRNSTGEAIAANYVSKAVTDTIGVPTAKVSAITFTDTDTDMNKIGGTLSWTAPADVTNVTHYVVYASADGTTKGTQIGLDVAVGTNQLTIPAGTTMTPYILVVTRNSTGEAASSNYVNKTVTDTIAVPTAKVSAITFTDTDTNTNKIGGTLSWTAPADVTNVTHYVVYASADGSAKGAQIGANVAVGTNQLTIPAGTTMTPYILVVTRNSTGEAIAANYVSKAVTDTIGVPTAKVSAITFTDTDSDMNKIGGTLSWTAPADVTNVTHYAVYASADGTTKGTQIGLDVAVGTNQLTIPAGTTMTPYILVVTRNSTGEAISSNYVNKAVTDTIAVPTAKVSAITFTDTDTNTNKIGGTLSWTAPADVTNVTHYVVYASADGSAKGAQIGANVAVGTNQLTIPAGTTMTPYILVVTRNSTGEAIAANYVNKAVTDTIGVPTAKVSAITFTDTDTDTNKIGGTLSWTAPTDVTNVTHYVVYTSADGSTKGTQIGSDVAVGTNQLTIPTGTTMTPYILVVTRNSTGEAIAANYVSKAVTDTIAVPTVLATGGSFTDTDKTANELTGTIGWTPADPPDGITGYHIYWGSSTTTKLAGEGVAFTITNVSTASTGMSYKALPSGATHFLIYSYNAGGDSASCLAVPITDIVKIDANASDSTVAMQAGDITAQESDVYEFVLTNYTLKDTLVASEAITISGLPEGMNYTVAKVAGKLVVTFITSANTAITADISLTAVIHPAAVTGVGAVDSGSISLVLQKHRFTSGSGSHEYYLNGTNATITSYLGSDIDVTTPVTIDGNPVVGIGFSAYANKNLSLITISNGVTSIGSFAFNNNKLISIVIPSTVTKIEDFAFNGNSLLYITIGANVDIGEQSLDATVGFYAQYVYAYGKAAGTYSLVGGTWTKSS